MSRRNKRKSTVERAAPSYSGPMGIQGDYAKYAGGNSVMIPAHVLAQMLQNLAPQKNQAKDFAPGSPLQPFQGVVPLGGPRQYGYTTGTNISSNDRTLGNPDVPSFAQLRNLAMLYSGVGLCERVILDMIPKLVPNVTLKKVFAEAGAQEKNYQSRITKWRTLLETPSPAQNLDIHSWLRMAWTEQTQIDALAIFKHKTRGGGLYGLEIIDGSSIKPVIDERGMVPDAKAGFPAYQQYPYGVPGDLYTTDQMIYYRESPRAFTPYGFSRVERIIIEVNQALRKKRKDLARFTEGNIPSGIMEVPDTSAWTPDQIQAYEDMWNALIAGNVQQQVRVKFTQPGMKYTRIDPEDIMVPFDEFLLNISAAAYGLSMQDLAFTGDIHKSSGDSQQNVMFRRTLAPLISVYSRLLTLLFAESFHDDMLEVTFGGFEEPEDLQSQATAYSTLTQNGIISPASVARIMKLPEIPETGPFILPKGGQPLFLEDLANPTMRKAQQQAQMAGLQLAAQGPQQQQQQVGNSDGEKQASGNTLAKESQPGQQQGDAGLEKAFDEADKSLDDLDAKSERVDLAHLTAVLKRVESLLRFDPVHGFHGEFGDFSSGTQQGGHTGHHGKHTGKHQSGKHSGTRRERMMARMQRLSARFEKLEARAIGKHWTAAQQAAAGKLGDIFSQLAQAVESRNQGQVDQLLDQAWTQAQAIFAGHTKGLAAMSRALTHIDAANEKGQLLRMDEGEDDETDLDELEKTLDLFEGGIDEQSTQSVTQRAAEQGAGVDSSAGERDSEPSAVQTGTSPLSIGTSGSNYPDKERSADLRRWRERAIEDVKRRRTQRGFTTTVIPPTQHHVITASLARCITPEHVRAVFARADAMVEPTLLYDPVHDIWEGEEVEQHLERYRTEGVQSLQWKTYAGVCEQCGQNGDEVVALGARFATGHRMPPVHSHCECEVIPQK